MIKVILIIIGILIISNGVKYYLSPDPCYPTTVQYGRDNCGNYHPGVSGW